MTYEVYTTTHPDDVKTFRDFWSAYDEMASLVEFGHSPVCERYGSSSSVRVMDWPAMVEEANQ